MEQTKTSIKIRPETWKLARIEAIKRGMTVSEFTEEALQAWIKK